jgi:hypothetical protein
MDLHRTGGAEEFTRVYPRLECVIDPENMRKGRIGLGHRKVSLKMSGNEADPKIVDRLDGASEGDANLDRPVAVASNQTLEVNMHRPVTRQPGPD